MASSSVLLLWWPRAQADASREEWNHSTEMADSAISTSLPL